MLGVGLRALQVVPGDVGLRPRSGGRMAVPVGQDIGTHSVVALQRSLRAEHPERFLPAGAGPCDFNLTHCAGGEAQRRNGGVFHLDGELAGGGAGEDIAHVAAKVSGEVKEVASVIEQGTAAGLRFRSECPSHRAGTAPVVRLAKPDVGDVADPAVVY